MSFSSSIVSSVSHSIETIRITSVQFPAQLAEIADPPELLYVRGNAAVLAGPAVAVVGSRAMTPYGKEACRKLVRELVQHNVVIVSGLAMGIDSMAHATALEYGGITIAVLGNGLDALDGFSPYRQQLADHIIANNGAIISEYPPTMPAQKQHFPARNRIIAGLSVATIVVEAAAKSGALITARLAMEYNREVGAVPGSIISARSAGTNKLLRDRAHVITSAEDMIAELPEAIQQQLAGDMTGQPAPDVITAAAIYAQNNPEQAQIIQCIETGITDANQLAQQLQISVTQLTVYLTDLEINGIVRKNSDSTYTLT